jgi:hypothetical protein
VSQWDEYQRALGDVDYWGDQYAAQSDSLATTQAPTALQLSLLMRFWRRYKGACAQRDLTGTYIGLPPIGLGLEPPVIPDGLLDQDGEPLIKPGSAAN